MALNSNTAQTIWQDLGEDKGHEVNLERFRLMGTKDLPHYRVTLPCRDLGSEAIEEIIAVARKYGAEFSITTRTAEPHIVLS